MKDKILAAKKEIDAYHAGAKPAKNIVKVVYFFGKDQEPLPNYTQRLAATLDDVSRFYKEEFAKFGVSIPGIPFEKTNSNYVFHLVKGDRIARSYTTDSGPIIEKEIAAKVGGEIDLGKEYVVVLTALSYKQPNGVYVFHSPYYGSSGSGSSANGICQVADCELLEPNMLERPDQKMVFSERTVINKNCSVAEFNSWYIGGIAHEMGHMLGLRHDFGNPSELTEAKLSLMGEQGSRHYREYLWNGSKSSILSASAVFQLLSHPLFTQSNKFRDNEPSITLPSVDLQDQDYGLTVKAQIKAGEKPYGVIALFRPQRLSEYYSRSYFEEAAEDGSVVIDLGKWPKGSYDLQLLVVFPNGKVWQWHKLLQKDEVLKLR